MFLHNKHYSFPLLRIFYSNTDIIIINQTIKCTHGLSTLTTVAGGSSLSHEKCLRTGDG